MWLCGAGVGLMLLGEGVAWWSFSAALTGFGMALLYPNLSAAVADIAHPNWRGSAIGIYRFWRDVGYGIGGLGLGLRRESRRQHRVGVLVRRAGDADVGIRRLVDRRGDASAVEPRLALFVGETTAGQRKNASRSVLALRSTRRHPRGQLAALFTLAGIFCGVTLFGYLKRRREAATVAPRARGSYPARSRGFSVAGRQRRPESLSAPTSPACPRRARGRVDSPIPAVRRQRGPPPDS